MKILFIVSSLAFGGAEKQTILDANLLSDVNDVYIITFCSGPQRKIIYDKVKYFEFEKKGYINTAVQLSKFIKKNRIQVVHASLFASMIISALASILCKIKVIWHFHSHEYDIPVKSKIAFRWLAKLPKIKKILFVNYELKNYFKPFKFSLSKTGVLYNHSEIKEPCFNVHIKKDDIVNIGFLGRVVELKRVEYLFDLAVYLITKKFYSFKIHIVGDGESLGKIKDLVSNNKLNKFFEFYGFQPNVVSFYKRFDFFVNPSSEECISIAMIDAGMMFLPIVAFNIGGNIEIVINNQTGFIVNTKNSFLEKCFELALNENLRKDMGMKAQQHCNRLFSREKHLEQLHKIYKELS